MAQNYFDSVSETLNRQFLSIIDVILRIPDLDTKPDFSNFLKVADRSLSYEGKGGTSLAEFDREGVSRAALANFLALSNIAFETNSHSLYQDSSLVDTKRIMIVRQLGLTNSLLEKKRLIELSLKPTFFTRDVDGQFYYLNDPIELTPSNLTYKVFTLIFEYPEGEVIPYSYLIGKYKKMLNKNGTSESKAKKSIQHALSDDQGFFYCGRINSTRLIEKYPESRKHLITKINEGYQFNNARKK